MVFTCSYRRQLLGYIQHDLPKEPGLWSDLCSEDRFSHNIVLSEAHLAYACNKTPPNRLKDTRNVHDSVTGKVQLSHKLKLTYIQLTFLISPSRLPRKNFIILYTKKEHTMQQISTKALHLHPFSSSPSLTGRDFVPQRFCPMPYDATTWLRYI